MVWQRNDDQYGVSRKVTRIPRQERLAAVGLDQLAKNYSVRALTDGVLQEVELVEVLATRKLVDALVLVDMWHREGHTCDRCVQPPKHGIVIHDFLEYNPSRVQVESQRETERVRKASQRDKSRTPDGTPPGRERPVPVPDPVPQKPDEAHPQGSSHVPNARAEETDEEFIQSEAAKIGIRNLPRVLTALQRVVPTIESGAAIDLGRAIVMRATSPVKHPEKYIEDVCARTPENVTREFHILHTGSAVPA